MDKEIQECIFKKLLNLVSELDTDSDDEDSLRMIFNGLSKSPYLTLNCLEELFLSEKFPDIDLSKINQLNPKDSIDWDWGNILKNSFYKDYQIFKREKKMEDNTGFEFALFPVGISSYYSFICWILKDTFCNNIKIINK